MVQVLSLNCNDFVEELRGKNLICHLYDFDQFIKTDKIGFVRLRLSTIPYNEQITIQKYIDKFTEVRHDHDEVRNPIRYISIHSRIQHDNHLML